MTQRQIKDIAKYELIGLNIKVVSSTNKANVGIEGKIVDETKQTLLVDTKKGKKRLLKKIIVIEANADNKKLRINGALLVGKPEDRIKVK